MAGEPRWRQADESLEGGPSVSGTTPKTTARDRALRLLTVRARSRQELDRRLREAGFAEDEVDTTLEHLTAVGLLDDHRFARDLARSLTSRRLLASKAVAAALRRNGISEDIAEEVLADGGDDADLATTLAMRQIRRMSGASPEVAYRRLYGLLARRGYESGVAHAACRHALREGFPGSAPAVGPGP